MPTSNDVVERNNLGVGYPTTRMGDRSQGWQPLDDGIRELMSCNFLRLIQHLKSAGMGQRLLTKMIRLNWSGLMKPS